MPGFDRRVNMMIWVAGQKPVYVCENIPRRSIRAGDAIKITAIALKCLALRSRQSDDAKGSDSRAKTSIPLGKA